MEKKSPENSGLQIDGGEKFEPYTCLNSQPWDLYKTDVKLLGIPKYNTKPSARPSTELLTAVKKHQFERKSYFTSFMGALSPDPTVWGGVRRLSPDFDP